MSVLAGQRVALAVALVLLTGCGVRVSLGEYGSYPYDGDGGVFYPDDPLDAEALDATDEVDESATPDASDDAPLADAIVD